MPTLFYTPGACSLAPHIMLEMTGKPYKLVKADRSSPDFLKVNPAGAVPAMILDDNTVLTQCHAILQYLAKLNPQLDLINITSPEKAAAEDRWCSFLTGDLHPAFFPLYHADRYISNGTEDEQARVKTAAVALVKNKLAVLNNELGDNQYLANNKMSIADIYSVPMLRWAKNLLPDGLASYPNLDQLYTRLLQLPAVQAAMQQQGITP